MLVMPARNPGRHHRAPDGHVLRRHLGQAIVPAAEGVMVNHVHFAPGGRTHWHTHETGQVLIVTAGEGRARTEGEDEHVIRAGDVVWIPAGERHWHGAGPDTFMAHIAVSIGPIDWQEPVSDEQYAD
jgi:quercetin dioxygenase-like cupin family protein